MSRSLQNQLRWAVKNDDFEKVKELLQNGGEINYEYKNDSRSLLHYACINGCLKIVKLFLENGADINYKDNYGGSPLDKASYFGKFEV